MLYVSPKFSTIHWSPHFREYRNLHLAKLFIQFTVKVAVVQNVSWKTCVGGEVQGASHRFPPSAVSSCTGCLSFTSSSLVSECWKLRMASLSSEQAGSMPTALHSPSTLCEPKDHFSHCNSYYVFILLQCNCIPLMYMHIAMWSAECIHTCYK